MRSLLSLVGIWIVLLLSSVSALYSLPLSIGGRTIPAPTATPAPTPTPIPVPAGPDVAKFIAQSIPTTMVAGRSYAVTVTMLNNGTNAWNQADASKPYNLGCDLATPPYYAAPHSDLGPCRIAANALPGSQQVFAFNLVAPSTPGTYSVQYRMVHDGVAWFGDLTSKVTITVTAAPPPPPLPATVTVTKTCTITATLTYTGTVPQVSGPVTVSCP